MEIDFLTAVTDLTETIDRFVGTDPSTFADAESIETLMRQLTRLEAVARHLGSGVTDGRHRNLRPLL